MGRASRYWEPGSLDGVDLTDLGFYGSAGDAYSTHALFIGGSRSTFVLVAYKTGQATGYLLTRPDGPLGGATYCIGPGSTIDNSGFAQRVSLVQLSRVASCDG